MPSFDFLLLDVLIIEDILIKKKTISLEDEEGGSSGQPLATVSGPFTAKSLNRGINAKRQCHEKFLPKISLSRLARGKKLYGFAGSQEPGTVRQEGISKSRAAPAF